MKIESLAVSFNYSMRESISLINNYLEIPNEELLLSMIFVELFKVAKKSCFKRIENRYPNKLYTSFINESTPSHFLINFSISPFKIYTDRDTESLVY